MKKIGEGKDDEKRVYLNDEFEELARKDDPILNPKLLFGAFTIMLIKLISELCFAEGLSIKLYRRLKEKEAKRRNLQNRK